jgi:hypothetical protein
MPSACMAPPQAVACSSEWNPAVTCACWPWAFREIISQQSHSLNQHAIACWGHASMGTSSTGWWMPCAPLPLLQVHGCQQPLHRHPTGKSTWTQDPHLICGVTCPSSPPTPHIPMDQLGSVESKPYHMEQGRFECA